ncbi:hypothetical protein WJX77_002274 [Trebouxia sp. C0004]
MSTMSITAANLADGIRVDQVTQKGSVYDVISVVTKATSAYAVAQQHFQEEGRRAAAHVSAPMASQKHGSEQTYPDLDLTTMQQQRPPNVSLTHKQLKQDILLKGKGLLCREGGRLKKLNVDKNT